MSKLFVGPRNQISLVYPPSLKIMVLSIISLILVVTMENLTRLVFYDHNMTTENHQVLVNS